jgi:hypothetical protein
MNPTRHATVARLVRRSLAAAFIAATAGAASAQDYGAMLRQAQMQSDQMSQQMNQMTHTMVQQRMNDPQVRAGYQQYLAQMRSRGQPAMDFPTYTYNWIYTRGFSRDGIAHARATEAGIQANERASVQGLRDAEARRGAAQQQQRDSYFHNQQEAGRGLMGQSTYSGQGFQGALPHTWQANSTHVYQGNTYHVNESGQYFVRGTNGWWYPINR